MISVIIPTLNESNEILNKTINSIYSTSPGEIEVIVIDDNSNSLTKIYNKKPIYEKNAVKLGAAKSKHIGVCLSSKKYIFLTDSHVLFEKGWYEGCLKSLENKPRTLWCGTCLGLSAKNFDLSKANGAYVGAKLFLYDEKDKQILDGKWMNDVRGENNYEISCVMGANYFMHKDWFFKIRGYGDLRAWGSEEPCLSIKTWLSGGDVRLNKLVRTGHLFRDAAPYSTNVKEIIYNKIRMAKTFLPDKMSRILISKLPQTREFFEACKMINSEATIIKEYKGYYRDLFNRDIEWVCNKFDIKTWT